MTDSIAHDRRGFLGSAAAALAAARFGSLGALLQQAACAPRAALAAGELASLGQATGWLNSPALTPAALRGRVVLVDFWTYTCINWLRQLPYVRAWADRYADRGLVVVGVHTPEFAFEKDLDNVRRAVRELDVPYPVAVDSDYAIWNAFRNRYWPALYLLDAEGRIRFSHFGEGEYGRSEGMIRKLLEEAGADDPGDPVAVEGRGIEAAADWGSLESPETYLGYARAEGFASPGGMLPGGRQVYAAPARLARNQWALSGDWAVEGQPATLHAPGGRIVHRFHARDVHLVMGPAKRGEQVRFRVRLDGSPPGDAHGIDVDAGGGGTAAEQRLYQLIRQPGPVADRQFEIEFLDPGIQAFAFTFG